MSLCGVDEDTFVAIRILLEECRDLNLYKETDRLVLAHQISKKMNLHMEKRDYVGFPN